MQCGETLSALGRRLQRQPPIRSTTSSLPSTCITRRRLSWAVVRCSTMHSFQHGTTRGQSVLFQHMLALLFQEASNVLSLKSFSSSCRYSPTMYRRL